MEDDLAKAQARIAELECHLSAICEQADRPEYSGRYAELLRRIAEASALIKKGRSRDSMFD